VPNEPRKENLDIVMSNSLGFGGQNASIILKKFIA
jgi:3-oxoacyl-[acyl-carrier-protein] synthase II